jgi:hypothetical protein
MKALAIFLVWVFLSFGCAVMKPEEKATLHVECNMPDAAVLLDDALVGRVADLAKKGVSIEPGFYRVEIRQPGCYPYFGEIKVAEGGVAVVKAELHPLLD